MARPAEALLRRLTSGTAGASPRWGRSWSRTARGLEFPLAAMPWRLPAPTVGLQGCCTARDGHGRQRQRRRRAGAGMAPGERPDQWRADPHLGCTWSSHSSWLPRSTCHPGSASSPSRLPSPSWPPWCWSINGSCPASCDQVAACGVGEGGGAGLALGGAVARVPAQLVDAGKVRLGVPTSEDEEHAFT
jgi:hypothetical protein